VNRGAAGPGEFDCEPAPIEVTGPLPPPVGPGDLPQLYRLSWDVFERMGRALYNTEPGITKADSYGTRGQTQHGIDILAHRDDGALEVAQCKGHESMTVAKLRKASQEFLNSWDEVWATKSVRKFTLMVACDLSRTELQDQILIEKHRFAEKGVDYEVWHLTTFTDKLRKHRDIVEEYLGNRGWADQLCGGQSESSIVVDSLMLKEIESLRETLSQARATELDLLKERWRKGYRREAREWVESQRGSTDWGSLSVDVRAAILRFGARATALGDPGQSQAYLAEARALKLDETDSYVDALIVFAKGDAARALEILETLENAASLKLRTAILIEENRLSEAQLVIQTFPSDDAEVCRLQTLLSLFDSDVSAALETIRKAEATDPESEAIRHIGAIVRYYAALSPAALPKGTFDFLTPVPVEFLRDDRESRNLLLEAAELFERLRTSTQSSRMERDALAWRIASLLNLREPSAEAEILLSQALASDPTNVVLVHWAAARVPSMDLSHSAQALEKSVAGSRLVPGQVLALCHLYLERSRTDDAVVLLEQQRQAFEETGLAVKWANWYVRSLAVAGRFAEALAALDTHGLTNKLWHLGLQLLEIQGADRGEIADLAFQEYQKIGDPASLLQACEIRTGLRDWTWVAEHAGQLVAKIQTPEALVMGAGAAFNAGRWEQCLTLLKGHELTTFPLREMQVMALLKLGKTRDAAEKVRQMEREFGGLPMLRLLAHFYWEVRDHRSLAYVAGQIADDSQSQGDELIRLAHALSISDPDLASSLWTIGIERGVSDTVAPLAFRLSFTLGLSSEPVAEELVRRVVALASAGADPSLQMASVASYKELQAQQEEHGQKLHQGYLDGAPVHVIAKMTGMPLALPYRAWLAIQESGRIRAIRNPLFIRNGRRTDLADQPEKTTLYADVTGLMLAHHFDFLGLVETEFAPIHIPPECLDYLSRMIETLELHQPDLIAADTAVIEMSQRRQIDVLDGDEIRDIPEGTTVGQFQQLLARARSSRLLNLRPGAKSTSTDLSLQELLQSLMNLGVLASAKLSEAASILGHQYAPCISESAVQRGQEIIASPLALRELQRAGLLEPVSRLFRVAVLSAELGIAVRELEVHKQKVEAAGWVRGLQRRLARGLKSGTYQPLPRLPHYKWKAPELAGLENLLGNGRGQNSVLWIDDRGTTHGQRTEHGATVVNSLEILAWLRAAGSIKTDGYFALLNRMRASGVMFLPLTTEEILHWLGKTQVLEGEVLETAELSTLRKSAASSLLYANHLQRPVGENPGEWPYLLRHAREVADALADCFTYFKELSTSFACANWLLAHLYINPVGLREAAGVDTSKDDPRLGDGEFANLAYEAVARISGISAEERQARRAYLRWLWAALGPTVTSTARFADNVSTHLAANFVHYYEETDFEGREDLERAYKMVVQVYFDDLPGEIRDALEKVPEFSTRFELKIRTVVTVDSVSIDSQIFLESVLSVTSSPSPVALLTVEVTGPEVCIPVRGCLSIGLVHAPASDTRLADPQLSRQVALKAIGRPLLYRQPRLRPQRSPGNPQEFLEQEPHLRGLVEKAEKKLLDAFGAGTSIRRELSPCDDEGSPPMLFLVAQVKLPSDEARSRMDQLDQDWWLDQLPLTEGKVQIAFEHGV
jgi:hypothetical protein